MPRATQQAISCGAYTLGATSQPGTLSKSAVGAMGKLALMPNSGSCKGAHWRILVRSLACSIEARWSR
jgi:hypothetical protein